MRFTADQYYKAKENIDDALQQIQPDGRHCIICHDSGHQAWECGSNPLLAWALCNYIQLQAQNLHDEMHSMETPSKEMIEKLHEFMHFLAGYDRHMGEGTGPAKMRTLSDDIWKVFCKDCGHYINGLHHAGECDGYDSHKGCPCECKTIHEDCAYWEEPNDDIRTPPCHLCPACKAQEERIQKAKSNG